MNAELKDKWIEGLVQGRLRLKMNITEEQRTEWVKALRSGKYLQGKMYLKSEINGEVRHCCLGVLLETLGVSNTPHKSGYVQHTIYMFGSMNVSGLPVRFGNPYGLFKDSVTGEKEQLSTLNDTYKMSFNDIANVIESCQLVEG